MPRPTNISETEYQAFYEEVQSNSHLIAAAPELLLALGALRDEMGVCGIDRWGKLREAVAAADAAIAKATGAK